MIELIFPDDTRVQVTDPEEIVLDIRDYVSLVHGDREVFYTGPFDPDRLVWDVVLVTPRGVLTYATKGPYPVVSILLDLVNRHACIMYNGNQLCSPLNGGDQA